MPDIIQLLPDSVANQIAAGEVIQRPASVVKELVENAIDAGASQIKINLKDAGRTLIQVSDNGCGMSDTDARMAFERHATSKIKSANDLFEIRTMGFRGEALASIAAIADVELHTCQHDQEIGTFIHINGSKVIKQEATSCACGTNFMVKNLFFNVPARRKFLKANSTELKHVITEVQRIALANSDISFSLIHNQQTIYELGQDNIRKRIGILFGKNSTQNLIPVNTETSLVNITGYIGQPKHARKTFGEQFFFVNKRYMRHSFFHKAVMQAYEKILPPDSIPSYFLFFEVKPESIDINIHPTKTEIKFESESAIWQMIRASVRESLGRHNVVPSIDFDQAGSIEIPLPPKNAGEIRPPEIEIDPTYNPFEEEKKFTSIPDFANTPPDNKKAQYWEKLYRDFAQEEEEEAPEEFPNEKHINQKQNPLEIKHEEQHNSRTCFQFKNKYILTPVKSGLMVIDQKRAHERILFENFMAVIETNETVSQQQLFPHTFDLNPADAELLRSVLDDLKVLGFDIRDFGNNSFIINGTPGMLDNASPLEVIESLLEDIKSSATDLKEKARENVAASLARASAISYGYAMKLEEINQLIDQLFACSTPNFSPSGKQVLTIMPIEHFEKLLK
ncbi:DNA mismatch repair endonuclease MutL [Sunxiuqinia elliptica]|uniref:DNA mismatch repair protein MutL n=1 Tax=Sunxiuqinia elliptica TaxID=655355 RepID=A0A4R6H9E3_9BACT|nr:DNA mismatch repair endonuclease MutL [Sunxiuqinia elliptica]TDO05093.1 DNA mismatch repair protein MutL [Sunxiuqinia elliptica]TDO64642.1 DNA mismatch repair protein MutL [Sunxiuqinia elliptica]